MRTRSWMARSSALVAAVVFSGSTLAVIPDSGWYWNSGESGRGFNIEIQNNVLFIAGFLYDQSGNQIWIVSGGPMSSDRTYSGPAFQATNGQPLGGAYRTPTNVPFGTATVTWTTTTAANININGYAFSVTRDVYGFDFSSLTEPLLGEFALVTGNTTLPDYFGERITFSSTQPINGTVYAVGNRTGESGANSLALGHWVAALGKWTVLIDSAPSYWDYYTFTFEGVNFVEGDDATYLKGSLPNGSLNALGVRVRSAQAAAGGNAPGAIHSASVQPSAEKAEIQASAKMSSRTIRTIDASTIEELRSMEAALQSLR